MGRRRIVREGKATGTFVRRGRGGDVSIPAVTVVATFDHEPGRTFTVDLTQEQVTELMAQLKQQEVRDRTEYATCSDCGREVYYTDDGYWPWIDYADGSDICEGRDGNKWHHRINRDIAEDIFSAFKIRTGQRARHS